jgi:septin family protein
LDVHAISIYPLLRSDDDAKEEAANRAVRELLPLAVVGSRDAVLDKGGKTIRGRKLPGGFIEVDNPKHCEFSHLRNLLLKFDCVVLYIKKTWVAPFV